MVSDQGQRVSCFGGTSISRQAEEYFELGMIGEAWEATENLEPLDRCEPLAVEMRVRIATAGEKWELGEALANVRAPVLDRMMQYPQRSVFPQFLSGAVGISFPQLPAHRVEQRFLWVFRILLAQLIPGIWLRLLHKGDDIFRILRPFPIIVFDTPRSHPVSVR